MSSTLVDQLKERLLTFEPLLKILEAVGVDPAGPDAKRLVSDMLDGLDHGIQRIKAKQSRQTANSKWTRADDTILTLAIEWGKWNTAVSARPSGGLLPIRPAALPPTNPNPAEEHPSPILKSNTKKHFGDGG